jgi:integrase/recombinase XerD
VSDEASELAGLVASYLEALARRGQSPTTCRLRADGLRRWLRFVAARGVRAAVQIRPEHVRTFQVWLADQRARCGHRRGQPLAANTRQSLMASVRGFCRWLVRTDVLLLDPAAGMPLPRVPRGLPCVLTPDEVARILDTAAEEDPMARRDRAILEVLYSCGLRMSELLGLNVADVELAAGEVLVRNAKGGRWRRVPLGEPAARAVAGYLDRARLQLPWPRTRRPPDPRALFLTRQGTRAIAVSVAAMIRRRARQAQVAGHVTAHTYRHTAAVHLLRGGADVRHVQELLGHASADTTIHYTRLTVDDLKAELARCHPRERGGGRR